MKSKSLELNIFHDIMSELSITKLSDETKKYVENLLSLQGDVEYGFFNLLIEWQSKDDTSSEQRWRISRIVTDEVGHGLNVVRTLKQISSDEVIRALENKPFGSHKIKFLNTRLENWNEVIAFILLMPIVDSYNVRAFAESKVSELRKLGNMILKQEKLHPEFARNSIAEVIEGKSKLGSREGLITAIEKIKPHVNKLHAYGELSPGNNQELGITFKSWEEVRKDINSFLKELLAEIDIDIQI